MRQSIYQVFGIGICLIGMSGCGPKKPTLDEAKALFDRDFVTKPCSGQAIVKQLEVIRIGDFIERFKGFPVYADYTYTCSENAGDYVDVVYADKPAVLIRSTKSGEGFELFGPNDV
jgi:hypothetical protein